MNEALPSAGPRPDSTEVGGGVAWSRGPSGSGARATEERPALRPRILLAEDDAQVRSLVAEILRAEGYEVVEAADGSQLIELVETLFSTGGRRRAGVSMVLSDVRMPGEFSGIDILWILRAVSWEIPVVLMGTWEDDPARIEAGELGANAFLRKPLDPEALRRVVRAVLRGALPARVGSVV